MVFWGAIPTECQEALLPQFFTSACTQSDSLPPSCDRLTQRFGNAVDGPDRTPSYNSDMTEVQ